MSEFSSSCHLIADDQEAGVELLRRARQPGWVFLPTHPWVTVVEDIEFAPAGQPSVIEANEGVLLAFDNAEDHGWAFRLFRESHLVSAYEMGWTDEIEVDSAGLNMAGLQDALSDHVTVDWERLDEVLHPESEDELFEEFLDHTPGHEFATLIGLRHFEWLSGHYLKMDGGRPDAVYVEP